MKRTTYIMIGMLVTRCLHDPEFKIELYAVGQHVPGQVPLGEVPFGKEQYPEIIHGLVLVIIKIGEGYQPLPVGIAGTRLVKTRATRAEPFSRK